MYFCLLLYFVVGNQLFTAFALKPRDIRNHLATRTPYRFTYNKDDSRIKYPNCKDSKIWMLVRHGTRLPSAKDIVGMNSTLKDLRNEILLQHNVGKAPLDSEQIKNFEGWSSEAEVEKEKFLTLEGQEEMILLAERMHKRFPNAIRKRYNNNTFEFRYTPTQRAQQSAQSFTLGLFSKKEAQNVVFRPAVKVDTTLRFYKHCHKWQQQVKKNPLTYKEQELFAISQAMNETRQSISKRLGLNRVIDLDTALLMYKICGYETSWHKHIPSPWCHAFDLESIQVLEYYFDLKHYWLDGYGHDLTYRPACMLMKNMLHNFENGPNATFLFAHSGTLLKFLSYLKLYKPDSHLTANAMDKSRIWKASLIDCFASNIAFVVLKCKDGDQVLTLHQERIIKLPICDTELCPYDKFKEYFKESVLKCDYTDMCKLN